LQNYITMTDDKGQHPTTSEKHQFINLITENTETLFLGFNENFDYQLHLDGSANPDAIIGLDAMVSTTPTTGTVGGHHQDNSALAAIRLPATAGLLATRSACHGTMATTAAVHRHLTTLSAGHSSHGAHRWNSHHGSDRLAGLQYGTATVD
jgi:hypothetical protein